MNWNNQNNGGDGPDKKNPWGRPGNEQSGQNPWNSRPQGGPKGPRRGGAGGGQEPPDLDDLLRRFQDGMSGALPPAMQGVPVIAIIAGVILALWLASGFYVVNPGEHAVVQRFGAWAYTKAEPGLGYRLPGPIDHVTLINVEEIRKMSIGINDPASELRFQGQRAAPEESLMLTADRNIVDLDLEVQWNIKSSEDYLFRVQDQEGTIKKVAESAIREIVGQTPMFQIITNQRQQVADRTKTIIQSNLDEYKSGVNILQVLIQKAEVHPDVQDAFQDVQSAKQDAEDVQNRAQAYREDILPKARGQAIQMMQEAEAYNQSNVARATGDAKRFNSIYEAYSSGKDVTRERIYIETMEDVFKNASKTIIDPSSSQGVVPYLPLKEPGGAAATGGRPSVPPPAAQGNLPSLQ